MKVMTKDEMELTLRCAELEHDLKKALETMAWYEKMLGVVHAVLFPQMPFEELTADLISHELEGLIHESQGRNT